MKRYELLGSPNNYPSPLDRRTGKLERAAQFGLSYDNEESFECNQSFPRALQMPSKLKHQNDLTTLDLNQMKGKQNNFFVMNSMNISKIAKFL